MVALVASAGGLAVGLGALMVAAYNDAENVVRLSAALMVVCTVAFWVTIALAIVRLVSR